PATASRLMTHFGTLLAEVAQRPGRLVGDLELLTAGERHQLLVDWNHTAWPYPQHRLLHELFEEQAARRPEAPALIAGERTLSFDDLNRSANRLAHHLRSLGVGPEDVVGL